MISTTSTVGRADDAIVIDDWELVVTRRRQRLKRITEIDGGEFRAVLSGAVGGCSSGNMFAFLLLFPRS